MPDLRGAARRADRLARRIALATAAAWVGGVVVLTALAVAASAWGLGVEVDGRLRAHAVAAYGLTWWEPDGTFHPEILAKEAELLDPDVTLILATPKGSAYGPDVGPDADLVAAAMETQGEVWSSRTGRRVLAIPAYDEADRLVGAVLASTATGPLRASVARLALVLGAVALGFSLLGVAVSRWLARRLLTALLASVDERERVLAGAAHELRNPLAALVALAESPAPDALEQVAATSREAAELVDRLLTWSRLADAAPEVEPLRLDLLVETLLEEGEPLEAEAVTCSADPRLLRVALDNLLRNARTHGGGVERVVVSGRSVTVVDGGPGVDPALLAPFAKGAASAGTGLGLALVLRIVEAHGGRLDLGPPIRLVLPDS